MVCRIVLKDYMVSVKIFLGFLDRRLKKFGKHCSRGLYKSKCKYMKQLKQHFEKKTFREKNARGIGLATASLLCESMQLNPKAKNIQ
jgi:hypothetical protein